jgi:hypothetical protein
MFFNEIKQVFHKFPCNADKENEFPVMGKQKSQKNVQYEMRESPPVKIVEEQFGLEHVFTFMSAKITNETKYDKIDTT